ncbi:hypothetical protein [Massilia scottii]|uniref:hypothetical protein n=1 Tax=Massilia scottii TaxID=3057166 RepID=UPI0027968C2A|nr:hypothetical protein [Massilia sp. CCM 9029]MDQ1835592.1 hypothetical protein [Massilia sp. CCM 9029]
MKVIVFLMVMLSGFSYGMKVEPGPKADEVSLQELLQMPEKFHLNKIRVYGYLSLQSGNYSLMTEGCSRSGMLPRGTILIELAPTRKRITSNADGAEMVKQLKKYIRFHQKCVWVTGIFDKTLSGGWSVRAGGLKEITAITVRTERSEKIMQASP